MVAINEINNRIDCIYKSQEKKTEHPYRSSDLESLRRLLIRLAELHFKRSTEKGSDSNDQTKKIISEVYERYGKLKGDLEKSLRHKESYAASLNLLIPRQHKKENHKDDKSREAYFVGGSVAKNLKKSLD